MHYQILMYYSYDNYNKLIIVDLIRNYQMLYNVLALFIMFLTILMGVYNYNDAVL